MYNLLRPFFFKLDPECAHYAALQSLQFAYQLGLTRFFKKPISHPLTVMGLTFSNPIGLSAGLDKNADYLDALGVLGFGFIEIGTVTPKPQIGNPKPRLFRLKEQEAIINRMGFNNKGIAYVLKQLEKTNYRGILGINIGKNKETPLETAIDDYMLGFKAFWKYASYITINISSPNTPGLRELQQSHWLKDLLAALKREQAFIHQHEKKYVPLVVKIAPDLSQQEIKELAQVFTEQKIDGVIATNTTLSRENVSSSLFAKETGGLSGRPLLTQSTAVLKQLHNLLPANIPLIASGGVMDETSAAEKFAAGAQLIQIYTGFIYAGPGLIGRLGKISNIDI